MPLRWGAGRLDAHYRRFSQSQHTGPANQSDPIVYFWGRGYIKAGNDERVYQRRDIAVWNKGKLCEK